MSRELLRCTKITCPIIVFLLDKNFYNRVKHATISHLPRKPCSID